MMMKSGLPIKRKPRCSFAPIDLFGSPVEFNINGEGSYKTIVGCIWTVLMAALMIAATVYYLVIYSDKTNVTLSSQSIQGSETPLMNFTEKGLFVVLMFQKGKEYARPNDVEPYFSVSGSVFTYSSTSNSSTNERTFSATGPTVSKIDFAPCRSANVSGIINGQKILGKTDRALSDFGYCAITKNSSFFVQGDDDSDSYSYIEINIRPCQGPYSATTPIPKGSCALRNPQISPLTGGEPKAIRDALRDYRMTLMLIDTAIDATNYDSPFVYIMNSNYHYYPTINSQKTIDFIFKTVTVSTDKGVILSDVVEESSFSIGEVIYDSKDRDPNDVVTQKTPSGDQSLPVPYMTFNLRSGNEKVTYTRTYLLILDVIGLVGGVSQVFTIAVVIMYSWYNSIRMEQEMINRTILNINEGERPLEDWEQDIKFSFSEIFRFKYMSCCNKKNKKYASYMKCSELMDDKTDITKIIRAVADIQTIKEALLTPAQTKLMQYASINSVFADKDDDFKDDVDSLSIQDAIKDMKTKTKSGKAQKDFDTRINEFLLEKIPGNLGNRLGTVPEAELSPVKGNQISAQHDMSKVPLAKRKVSGKDKDDFDI